MTRKHADAERESIAARIAEAGLDATRFVQCRPGSKASVDHTLSDHGTVTGNYGIYATADDALVIFDVDEYDGNTPPAVDALPLTLTQTSPHGGEHLPFVVDMDGDDYDTPAELIEALTGVVNPAPSWGEIRVANQYVVGAGSQLDGCDKEWCDECATPDGGRYELAADREIATLTARELVEVLWADDATRTKIRDELLGHTSGGVTGDVAARQTALPDTAGTEPWRKRFDSADDLLTHAREKQPELDALLRGDYSGYRSENGDTDRSGAEQAAANMLAWWFDGDDRQIRTTLDHTLGTRSGTKWGERGDDYRTSTVESATSYVTDAYDPDHGSYERRADRLEAAGIDPEDFPDVVDGSTLNADTDAEADTEADTDTDDGPTETELWERAKADWAAADNADERKRAGHTTAHVMNRAHHFANVRSPALDAETLYWYDPDMGVYVPTGESHLREILYQHLDMWAYDAITKTTELVKRENSMESYELNPPVRLIPVGNGVIDVRGGFDPESRTLKPPSPRYRFRTRAPTEYDPEAECPEWEAFLEQVTPDGTTLKKIQEFAGYTLLQGELPFAKALFIVGQQATGKSTFIEVFSHVLDGGNPMAEYSPTANLTVHEITGDRFKAHQLQGAWANFRAELPADLLEKREAFKEIIAGDTMQAERKFKDSNPFRPTAKHVYSANELPGVQNADDAFYRRILLAPFPNTVPRDERDPDLSRKLKAEASGILNWALDGLARLMDQGGFTGDTVPALTRETWDKWGNSVRRFYDGNLATKNGESVAAQDVYDAYQEWARQQGVPARSYSEMAAWLTNQGGQYDDSPEVMKNKAYFKEHGGHRTAFIGLAFNDDGEKFLMDDKADGDDDPTTFW